VDRHFETPFLGGEIGNEPWQFLDFFRRRQWEDKTGAPDRLQFDDLGNFDPADIPMHPAFLLVHDPEKWLPVFRKDHAPNQSMIRKVASGFRLTSSVCPEIMRD
jgi:hypothetical protein